MQNPSGAKGALPSTKNAERKQTEHLANIHSRPREVWHPSSPTMRPMENSARGSQPAAYHSEPGRLEDQEQYPSVNRRPMEVSTRQSMGAHPAEEAKPEQHNSEDKDRH